MFYQVEPFAFARILKQNMPVIRDEFAANFNEKDARPWPQSFVYDKYWKLAPLIDHGRMAQHGALGSARELERNQAHFPRTMAALGGLTGLVTAGFSRLTGESRIFPHKGIDHTVLRVHLGLITPPDCAIHVHGQVRPWTEGGVFMFDDTYAHEVWNKSPEVRVILIMDFSKPELERQAGRPLDALLEPHTPEDVQRGEDLERRFEVWQKKYAEAEPEPDWERIFNYDVEAR